MSGAPELKKERKPRGRVGEERRPELAPSAYALAIQKMRQKERDQILRRIVSQPAR